MSDTGPRHRTDPQKNLVGFVVGPVAYAVDISRVREIVNPLEVTPQLAAVEEELGGVQPGEELMLSTPVKTIIPWQDW